MRRSDRPAWITSSGPGLIRTPDRPGNDGSEKGNSRTCPGGPAPLRPSPRSCSPSPRRGRRGSSASLLDPAGLAARASEVAARQRSPETRRTYATVYRTFCAFLSPNAGTEHLTPETVRAYRDRLERRGRTPATVAKHLSALRQLAQALDADPAIRTVRSQSVARGEPRALSEEQFERLLRMPDGRTRQGKRDLVLLHLLGSAGLRRAEAANLLITDVDERKRASDPRLRAAIARSTSWWVTIRYGKRGRTRAPAAVAAAHRPAATTAGHPRHRPDRGPPRAGRRAARGPSRPARPAPHLLHPPRQ